MNLNTALQHRPQSVPMPSSQVELFRQAYTSGCNLALSAMQIQMGLMFEGSTALWRQAAREVVLPQLPVTDFGINSVVIDIRVMPIEVSQHKISSFSTVWHFRQPDRMRTSDAALIVAPKSGHGATIVGDLVQEVLRDRDVYVLESLNPYVIPYATGRMDLATHVDDIISTLQLFSIQHLVGPSQGGVVATIAMAHMKSNAAQYAGSIPKTLMPIGSPIDTRIAPNYMCDVAKHWHFYQYMFSVVPTGLAGAGRRVWARNNHTMDHIFGKAIPYQPVAREAVLDTWEKVYRDHQLPRELWNYRGAKIALKALDGTRVLTIGASKDEMVPAGQTHALTDHVKHAHKVNVPGGHYDLMTGPNIRNVAHAMRQFIQSLEP